MSGGEKMNGEQREQVIVCDLDGRSILVYYEDGTVLVDLNYNGTYLQENG